MAVPLKLFCRREEFTSLHLHRSARAYANKVQAGTIHLDCPACLYAK
jgi:hypothetical protein